MGVTPSKNSDSSDGKPSDEKSTSNSFAQQIISDKYIFSEFDRFNEDLLGRMVFARTLDDFDLLCAEQDPVAILCDFAKTFAALEEFRAFSFSTFKYPSLLHVPTISDKYRHLSKKNYELARRVALCNGKNEETIHAVIKFFGREMAPRLRDPSHFLELLCTFAYVVPEELFSIVLEVAPESVRLKGLYGTTSLAIAVGGGRAPLSVIKAMVTAGDRERKPGALSVLEHSSLDGTNTIFGNAASWALSPHGDDDFTDRIEVMRYILDTGGTKNMLCTRSGAQFYPLHNVVDILRELKELEDPKPSQKHFEVTKELLLQATSKMYSAWTGIKAPSMIFAAIWTAQYMTGWLECKGGTSHGMTFDVRVDHDTVSSIVSALIEQDPKQLQCADERGNTLLHVAAGLDCWFGNRHKELYGTSWSYLVQFLLKAGGDMPLKYNCAGRLPIHIALSNYMTWDYGVKDLVSSKPEMLRIADPLTRLLPFMSAGVEKLDRSHSGCSNDEEVVLGRLETSYRLLREDPAVILLVWNKT